MPACPPVNSKSPAPTTLLQRLFNVSSTPMPVIIFKWHAGVLLFDPHVSCGTYVTPHHVTHSMLLPPLEAGLGGTLLYFLWPSESPPPSTPGEFKTVSCDRVQWSQWWRAALHSSRMKAVIAVEEGVDYSFWEVYLYLLSRSSSLLFIAGSPWKMEHVRLARGPPSA